MANQNNQGIDKGKQQNAMRQQPQQQDQTSDRKAASDQRERPDMAGGRPQETPTGRPDQSTRH